ncbi:ABC-type branched-chain amino acid transport system, substrate-binding protein [Sphingobacterium wenxiniae]|uniref:ABC-type branched-chain amino acid transport system, substrate-binding protein n=2 Tax=Sphingobacterium wenxiniae TaxID=683125 RepID=A0A1I6QNN5_9SPHI|nr:ABC-type branched-chain amino acid transport system, substrate-binding protein [Sphingobacterium wenxiniae]
MMGLLLFFGACSPKTTGVLRSPEHRGGVAGTTTPKEEESTKESKTTDATLDAKKAEALRNNIALILPFQLDRVNPSGLSKEDVTRSALALDFYQGLQLGLDQLSEEGKSFSLNVLDSKDDEMHSAAIARSEKISNAAIVIGPVYPKEIKTFGTNLGNKRVLQINPLAASKASDFGLPNLVSVTPSIDVHMKAIAAKVAKDYSSLDEVIIYNTSDNDGRQFLQGFAAALRSLKSAIQVKSVSNIEELNEALTPTGKNLLIAGTTDRFQLRTLLNNLEKKSSEELYKFKLYGHPLWDRIDFSSFSSFSSYSPTITAESHLMTWSADAEKFKEQYYTLYGVNPSDHSYKGYDAAIYFGSLLSKHGDKYADYITKESFDGLFSSYKFEYDDRAGYVNQAVSYKTYKGSSFQLN